MTEARYIDIFILGAGASKDYGLPLWEELQSLLLKHIKNKVGTDADVRQTLLKELRNIGESKKYKTVDKMISEVAKRKNGSEAEDVLFGCMGEIFEESRSNTDTENDWIEDFIRGRDHHLTALLTNSKTEDSTMFVNFNYDTVFLLKVIGFFRDKYESTSPEDRRAHETNTGQAKSGYGNCVKDIFHPHGIFIPENRDLLKIGNECCYPTCGTFRDPGTGNKRRSNPVSCHDAEQQFTFSKIKERVTELMGTGAVTIRLTFLGVGPQSLKFNVDKIFSDTDKSSLPIRNISYTCFKDCDQPKYEEYFQEFDRPGDRYKNCCDLAQGISVQQKNN